MDFSSDIKEQVRSQTDIVALIGEAVALTPQRGGREHVGLCCFHDDHNPSMRVYADRQSYRCWVCNAGGDCFSFVQEREKVNFPEALEILAKRAGIKLPERGFRKSDDGSRSQIYEALLWAQELFHKTFLQDASAKPARDYIASRGMSDEMIKQFRIGYHPNDWNWLQGQARGKFHPEQLLAARLIGERDSGGYHDHFVDRVLFPIRNERAQAVGFGGRILPGNPHPAKYWNSPESPVFQKSKLVFALDAARDEIRKTETVLICEGYTDVIACHQYGVKNTVATLGTALTDQHVTTLKRFAKKVVLVYDGDDAGLAAAERVLERFIAQDVDLRILTLPGGHDPDEFLASEGTDALRQLIETAPEALDFKLKCLQAKYPIRTLDGRQRILEEMLEIVAAAPRQSPSSNLSDLSTRELLITEVLSRNLSVEQLHVRARLVELRGQSNRRVPRTQPEESAAQLLPDETQRLYRGQLTIHDRMECELLEILAASPGLVRFVREVLADLDIRHPQLQLLLGMMVSHSELQSWSFQSFVGAMEDQGLKNLATWLDHQARSKDLTAKLRETGDDSEETCPPFLRRSIENLKWRREEQSQQQREASMSPELGEGSPPHDDFLRQALQFHQRRATKRTTA